MGALSVMPRAEPAAEFHALELVRNLAHLPDTFMVHLATDDRNAPLICRGEIVVVDVGCIHVTGGWMPVEGGLFLIEYCSPPQGSARYARRSRDIVQTFTDKRGRWWAGSLRRGMHRGQFFAADGPYADELGLADKLIGRVVGLFRPNGAAA